GGIDGERLRYETEHASHGARLAPRREARDLDVARVGTAQRGEDRERRRLAGAVGAEEADHLARRDLEAHPVERDARTEADAQPRRTHRRHGGAMATTPDRVNGRRRSGCSWLASGRTT